MATPNPSKFPRWITRPDGAKIIVNDHIAMSVHMGEEYDENAELVVKDPAPPASEPSPVIPFPSPHEPEPEDDSFAEPPYPPAAQVDQVSGEVAGNLREEVAESRTESNRPDAAHTEIQDSGRVEKAGGAADGSDEDLDPLGILEPGPTDWTEPAPPVRRRRRKPQPIGA